MCKIYVNTDPIMYESRTRSLRIRGVITTLRLENAFWNVLQEIAEREGKTTNQLITTLYEELTDNLGETGNFTSFLRVCCMRYLHTVERKSAEPQPMALKLVTERPGEGDRGAR